MRIFFLLILLTLINTSAFANKGEFNCTSDNESGHGEKNGACDDLGF
jgi:hypothetical protein